MYPSCIIFALASLKMAMGLAITTYPEVVPGPGLPSLAALGVTSAELYSMGWPNKSSSSGLFARYNANCGPDQAYANVNDIIACYHYLDKLGHQDCVAGAGFEWPSHFCYAGGAQIIGYNIDPHGGATSWCSDVALAVLWIIDHCTRPDQSNAGSQAANGNGGLVVVAGDKAWLEYGNH